MKVKGIKFFLSLTLKMNRLYIKRQKGMAYLLLEKKVLKKLRTHMVMVESNLLWGESICFWAQILVLQQTS